MVSGLVHRTVCPGSKTVNDEVAKRRFNRFGGISTMSLKLKPPAACGKSLVFLFLLKVIAIFARALVLILSS